MSERSTMRLVILAVLIVSLMVTLLSRLYYMQIASPENYQRAAAKNQVREVVEPAVRGLILDQRGRPMVSNRMSMVVAVDRTKVIESTEDQGESQLRRLAEILDMDYDDLWDRLQVCGEEGAKKPPVCWNGSRYQPIQVAKDVDVETAMQIMEQQEYFDGITAQQDAVRNYPATADENAAHLLGYLGPINDEELKESLSQLEAGNRKRALSRTDLVGRSGLESQYDQILRGSPAVTEKIVDIRGAVVDSTEVEEAVPGDNLVLAIDAQLQQLLEQSLADGVGRAQQTPEGEFAQSAAGVVLDVRNGNVLAMASYPSYNPEVWVGGISDKQYKKLVSKKSGEPLLPRAIQGQYPPGSTFKPYTTAAALELGYSKTKKYECPAFVDIGGRTFKNYETGDYGKIDLARALEVSCNSIFYNIAADVWERAGGVSAGLDAPDLIADAARNFGLGERTGVDLPSEAKGRVSDRTFKYNLWEDRKEAWCASAEQGYPELRETDPELADYYTQLDKENCVDGMQWRVGDALNAGIGQGETLATPLQMANSYAAIANGGTLWEPHLVKAVVDRNGDAVRTVKKKKIGSLDMSKSELKWLREALELVPASGSAETAFKGFPLDEIPVAGKTGSSQVFGKNKRGEEKSTTSWFVSFAPSVTGKPLYAMAIVVPESGTGGAVAAPISRQVYDGIYGVRNGKVDPSRSVLRKAKPEKSLPKFSSNVHKEALEAQTKNDDDLDSGQSSAPSQGQDTE